MNGQVVQMDYDVDAFNESFQELFNFLNEEIVSSIREQVKQDSCAIFMHGIHMLKPSYVYIYIHKM